MFSSTMLVKLELFPCFFFSSGFYLAKFFFAPGTFPSTQLLFVAVSIIDELLFGVIIHLWWYELIGNIQLFCHQCLQLGYTCFHTGLQYFSCYPICLPGVGDGNQNGIFITLLYSFLVCTSAMVAIFSHQIYQFSQRDAHVKQPLI